MAGPVYKSEWARAEAKAEARAGPNPKSPPRAAPGVRLALASACAFALVLAGCAAPAPAPTTPPANETTGDAHTRAIEASFSGTALATPVQPFAQSFALDVPQGAVGVNATLAWGDAVSRFSLALVDPDGEVAATGYPEADGRIVAATVEPPRSGTWTLKVGATLAANVPFRLDAAAELIVPDDNVVRASKQLQGFNEVNVIMEENASFSFSFNASQPIHWDVHSHPEGGVKYWMEGTDASKQGSFTAPARGIYSLLFANDQPIPVDFAFEMRGRFRLHSYSQ
jgi:hypothetical protein